MAQRPLKKANTKFLKSYEIDSMDNISMIRKSKKKPNTGISNLNLKEIHPLTENQEKVFDVYQNTNKQLVLDGYPGVGKSYLAVYLALNDLLYGDNGYERLIIIRSLIKGREIGHLPGNISEKQDPFFMPYHDICNDLFNRGDASEILIKKDLLQFENTSFLRGVTFNNCVVIIDEAQNENFHGLDTIFCRQGKNCRMIFCGDAMQTDLLYSKNDVSGHTKFLNILKNLDDVEIVNFYVDDIVRSPLIKSYIIEKMKTL